MHARTALGTLVVVALTGCSVADGESPLASSRVVQNGTLAPSAVAGAVADNAPQPLAPIGGGNNGIGVVPVPGGMAVCRAFPLSYVYQYLPVIGGDPVGCGMSSVMSSLLGNFFGDTEAFVIRGGNADHTPGQPYGPYTMVRVPFSNVIVPPVNAGPGFDPTRSLRTAVWGMFHYEAEPAAATRAWNACISQRASRFYTANGMMKQVSVVALTPAAAAAYVTHPYLVGSVAGANPLLNGQHSFGHFTAMQSWCAGAAANLNHDPISQCAADGHDFTVWGNPSVLTVGEPWRWDPALGLYDITLMNLVFMRDVPPAMIDTAYAYDYVARYGDNVACGPAPALTPLGPPSAGTTPPGPGPGAGVVPPWVKYAGRTVASFDGTHTEPNHLPVAVHYVRQSDGTYTFNQVGAEPTACNVVANQDQYSGNCWATTPGSEGNTWTFTEGQLGDEDSSGKPTVRWNVNNDPHSGVFAGTVTFAPE